MLPINLDGGIGLDYLEDTGTTPTTQGPPKLEPRGNDVPNMPSSRPIPIVLDEPLTVRDRSGEERRRVPPRRPIVQEPTRRGRREPRLNVLQRRQALLPAETVEGKDRRTNRNIAPDRTSLATKMALGHVIEPKTRRRRSPSMVVDERPWSEIVDYAQLFIPTSEGGYSVKDLRAIINKTGSMTMERSMWDRHNLVSILTDWLMLHGHYDAIKNKINSIPDYELQEVDRMILTESYNNNPLFEGILNNTSVYDIEETRRLAQFYINESGLDFSDTPGLVVDTHQRLSENVQWLNDEYGHVLLRTCTVDRFDTVENLCNNRRGLNTIVLDHTLDHVPNGREVVQEAIDRLADKGTLIIVSYDYAHRATSRRLRQPRRAIRTLNYKSLIDHYFVPYDPIMDPYSIEFYYPDSIQLLSWTQPLKPVNELIITHPDDPIVEIARVYIK